MKELWKLYKEAFVGLIQWPLDRRTMKHIWRDAVELFFAAIFAPVLRILFMVTLPLSALLAAVVEQKRREKEAIAAQKRKDAYYAAYGKYPVYSGGVDG